MNQSDTVSITSLRRAVDSISQLMTENRDYLVELDQVNGDGDLGISMDDGFRALAEYFHGDAISPDLGLALRYAAKVFNSSAPSSLGTILSFGIMGMAKSLKGSEYATFHACADALAAGVENIKEKAQSRPGEKTILDALVPGVDALSKSLNEGASFAAAANAASEAAAQGSEATRGMEAVHGRAAYSASRSLGILDGGSVVGKLIFQGISHAAARAM